MDRGLPLPRARPGLLVRQRVETPVHRALVLLTSSTAFASRSGSRRVRSEAAQPTDPLPCAATASRGDTHAVVLDAAGERRVLNPGPVAP